MFYRVGKFSKWFAQSNRYFCDYPCSKPVVKRAIQVLSRDHVPFIIGVFFISLYGFHKMMIFQALYTEKVQFENKPKLSKDNDQHSKHLLAK